jgi:hypothetical protein
VNKRITWLLLALLLVSIAVACAPAAVPTPQVVKETVVVQQTVPPVTVKETVVVPQTVVVPAPTSAPAPTTAPAPAGPVTLSLYDPTGAFEVTQIFAPRVADLNGKTICELSNDSWEAQRTFPLIESLLQKQFPSAKIITWDKFAHGNVATTGIDNDDTANKVKAAGCQAVIVGNAG